MPTNWTDHTPKFNSAFVTALKVQAALWLLSVLMLDNGQTHRAFWVAMLCQWATAWIILFRRPMHPSKVDLSIVAYGIIPLWWLIATYGLTVLHMLGLPTERF